ncbi:type II secretion system protein GspM [Butyrivibrio sp. FCS014]|uniref:type II secretion system protein GspM n=1 Tax=Butyrivibrio sp. FCS014 TaxID=1408304 RepID=UPI0004651448|nr:type II secretion system protein GspM [Butyrivibrio sp. FCS014]
MNILSRKLSSREKTLLVILVLIILAALYYLFIFQPVTDRINRSKENAASLEIQLATLDAKVAQIQRMQKSVEEYAQNGHIISIMPSYSAGKQELVFLNSTLAASEDYYVGFTSITREGNQIRREFSLKFTVDHYSEAENILNILEHSDLRCLISDLTVKPVEQKETFENGKVEASCVATFYETMFGGVADAELPEDSAKEQQQEVVGTYEYEPGSLGN